MSRTAKRSLRRLPKAHLHAHLDGSYPLDAVHRLAARHGVAFEHPGEFPDVWAFFAAYGTVPDLVRSHEDLAELCRALVHQEAAEGVFYLEPGIEPQLYAPRLGNLQQVTATMLAAFAEAATDASVEVGALLTINTDQDYAIADDLGRLAAYWAGRGVTAIGTAGFVEPADLTMYRPGVAAARAAGLQVVSHAGQTGGPASVAAVLDDLGASRISHGFRSIEDPDLVARLAAEGVVCDVCPTSNVALGVIGRLSDHPAPRLAAAGVPVTLNADDQLWFGASITDQYETARSVWGLDDATVARFALAGTGAAGMSATTRKTLETGVREWLEERCP